MLAPFPWLPSHLKLTAGHSFLDGFSPLPTRFPFPWQGSSGNAASANVFLVATLSRVSIIVSTTKLNSYISLWQLISCDKGSLNDKRMAFQHVKGGYGSSWQELKGFFFNFFFLIFFCIMLTCIMSKYYLYYGRGEN